MKILVDTREQMPLWKEGPDITRTKLDVGDYTTEKLCGHAVVERKSPGDLYGSIIQGHRRFRNMLIRAQKQNIKLVVVVECTESEFYGKLWHGAQFVKQKSNTLRKILGTMKVKYNFSIIWCHGPPDAQIQTFKWLEKEEKNG